MPSPPASHPNDVRVQYSTADLLDPKYPLHVLVNGKAITHRLRQPGPFQATFNNRSSWVLGLEDYELSICIPDQWVQLDESDQVGVWEFVEPPRGLPGKGRLQSLQFYFNSNFLTARDFARLLLFSDAPDNLSK
jgi:hypothetical protein